MDLYLHSYHIDLGAYLPRLETACLMGETSITHTCTCEPREYALEYIWTPRVALAIQRNKSLTAPLDQSKQNWPADADLVAEVSKNNNNNTLINHGGRKAVVLL